MDPESIAIFGGLLLCIIALGCISASEAALTSISRHRLGLLQEEDRPRGDVVQRLLEEPYRFKSALLLSRTGTTIIATSLLLLLFRNVSLFYGLAALIVLLVVMMIFSEGLPKAFALRNPAAAARLLAGPLAFMVSLLWPVAWLIGLLATPLLRLFVGSTTASTALVTEEELRMLVNVGEEEGLIEPEEREMIEGIFSFGDTMVREVMIPRVDIIALEEMATLDEALDLMIANGHSRIPVYAESIDAITGVLYAKDLLPWMRVGRRDAHLLSLFRPVHFVPETMNVDALLRDLQARKVHLAIAVDEYGGTAGLVTIEDLIEEIVGEIQDEYDIGGPPVQIIGEGELLVDARVLIDDINHLAGLHLESDESDRIGGMVFEQLARVPQVGDLVKVDGAEIEVVSVEGLRPRQLRLRLTRESDRSLALTGEDVAHGS